MMRTTRLMVFLAVFVLIGWSEARAQVLSAGLAPIQNASAAGARAPGAMVTASFGRRESVLSPPNRTFSSITTPEVPGFFEGFRSTAASVMAAQFSVVLSVIVDAVLQRSGILSSSAPPVATVPPDAGGNTGGGRNGGGRDGGTRTPGGRKLQR